MSLSDILWRKFLVLYILSERLLPKVRTTEKSVREEVSKEGTEIQTDICMIIQIHIIL